MASSVGLILSGELAVLQAPIFDSLSFDPFTLLYDGLRPAKAALVGMTNTMSKEWGRLKVCVNCVAFGFIDTRLSKANDDPETRIEIEGKAIQAGVPSEMLSVIKTMVPLGRAGTVEEAAGSIYLLCIPESDYISGQVLIVSGGLSL